MHQEMRKGHGSLLPRTRHSMQRDSCYAYGGTAEARADSFLFRFHIYLAKIEAGAPAIPRLLPIRKFTNYGPIKSDDARLASHHYRRAANTAARKARKLRYSHLLHLLRTKIRHN